MIFTSRYERDEPDGRTTTSSRRCSTEVEAEADARFSLNALAGGRGRAFVDTYDGDSTIGRPSTTRQVR